MSTRWTMAALIASTCLAGCDRPEGSIPVDTGNKNFEARIVGQLEGCNVYEVFPPKVRDTVVVICPEQRTSAAGECHLVPVGKTMITQCSGSVTALASAKGEQ